MKQRKCPFSKNHRCLDYGNCEDCEWCKLIKKYERKIKRLKEVKEEELERVRKETASEILNDIHRYNGSLFGTCFHKGHYVSDVRDLVKDIAEEYGVEVEE